MKQTEDKKNANPYEYEKQVKYYMDTYNLSEELACKLLQDELSHRLDARVLGHTEGYRKAEKKSEKENAELETQFKKDFKNLYEYSEKLKTQIKNLSQDETKIKEQLSSYINRTNILKHKESLVEFKAENREFSAGYVRALEDLIKHFEGIDYETID